MREENFLIVAINSTNLVMQLEKKLLERGVAIRVIPLPTELSSSCGFSLRGELDDFSKILSLFKEWNLDMDLVDFYSCEKKGLKKIFTPLKKI